MMVGEYQIRPRYGEVDQMGYVYHANYVAYCHQARTELFRSIGVEDNWLEKHNIMLPVISFSIDYKKPAFYDEWLTIKTTLLSKPLVRLEFEFEIYNSRNELISKAHSTVVCVEKNTRMPIKVPVCVHEALQEASQLN